MEWFISKGGGGEGKREESLSEPMVFKPVPCQSTWSLSAGDRLSLVFTKVSASDLQGVKH